jgi:hypothetical protein
MPTQRKVRSFTDRHVRTGIVSNQDRNREDWGRTPPFISVSTCNRAECIAKALAYVESNTGQVAYYQPDNPAI